MQPYPDQTVESFDRAAVPSQIAELWQEWPELDPGTARLMRDAISSRSRQRMQLAFEMLKARSELVQMVR